ncbi:nitroreductase family deazaflavin-dependent oxidoreductase [Dactylosporangium sp. NPDC005572]|uniref:nitroreductase family deazaflavin-dependent oxidoreductase n=1 Tax=Dactylosporangium sp. NPDC005572 TaxID=3156889 RepID=UPI0033A0E2E4
MAQHDDEPLDSPVGWVAQHIRDYVSTGGAKGHVFQHWPSLLLTTRGRRTGRPRRTALIYGRSGDDYVVVGSNGGKDEHPLWYHNLLADPEVTVQVAADGFRALARTAPSEERPRLWRTMADLFPTYDRYQAGTAREIPVVLLERR